MMGLQYLKATSLLDGEPEPETVDESEPTEWEVDEPMDPEEEEVIDPEPAPKAIQDS